VLVLFACGTAAVVGCKTSDANTAYLLTALSFGLVIVAMAYSIGNVSGCHVNPAVSLAMLITGKMTGRDFLGYVLAQFAGATVGAAILGCLAGWDCGFGANGLYQGDAVKSLAVEIILTFVFVLAVLGATSKIENGRVAGLVIGLSLTLVHIFGIHFTGTSVNPARSFGPALFAGGAALADVWVFLTAPMIGGAAAALVWKGISQPQD
jgi:aquaporin Z